MTERMPSYPPEPQSTVTTGLSGKAVPTEDPCQAVSTLQCRYSRRYSGGRATSPAIGPMGAGGGECGLEVTGSTSRGHWLLVSGQPVVGGKGICGTHDGETWSITYNDLGGIWEVVNEDMEVRPFASDVEAAEWLASFNGWEEPRQGEVPSPGLSVPPFPMPHTGLLVAFEGVDGSGKSTQADLLVAALHALGVPTVLTREPTGGPWGRRIRESFSGERLPASEELDAFMRDREEHVASVIRPALLAGKVVVVDRYYLSTVAYQGARGLDPDVLLHQNEAIAPRPDITLLFDLPVGEALNRVGRRGQANSFEARDALEKVAQIYGSVSLPGLVSIDANRAVAPVFRHVLRLVLEALQASVKHNCHTCKWFLSVNEGALECQLDHLPEVRAWQKAQTFQLNEMPVEDAEGCPPWSPKGGAP